jgi:hypothetical protein
MKKFSRWLQSGLMAGHPQPKSTIAVTAAQLEALAAEFENYAGRVRAAAKVAKGQPEQSLAMFNWASVSTGLRLLRGFIAKADESRIAAELGNPIPVGQLKSRSTAKNAVAAERERLQAEADDLAKEIRTRVPEPTPRTMAKTPPKAKRKAE